MDDVLRLALVERRPARRYRRLAHMHRAVGEAAPEILRAVGDRVARLQPLFLQEARRHGGDQRGIEGGEAREHDVDLGQGGPSCLAIDRKSTRLKSSHYCASRMPSSARKKKT